MDKSPVHHSYVNMNVSLSMAVTYSFPPADGVLQFSKEGASQRVKPVSVTATGGQGKSGCCIIAMLRRSCSI